ncbi:MAG: hypothetical protein KAT90_14240, partial [Gammaproteobacteria bacterium]|nr:hypothetical protein [Gammaproteobacteria bacterium]
LDGDIYIEAQQLNVKQWNSKFKFFREFQLDSVLDINIWASLENNNVQEVFTQLAAENIFIKNKATKKTWKAKYLSTKVRYIIDDGLRNIAISDFYFGKESKPVWNQAVNILASEDEKNYYLSVDYVRTSELENMLETFVTKEQQLNLNKFKPYQLQSDIYNLNLQLAKDAADGQLLDALYFDATVKDFSIRENNKGISLHGFDASIHYADKQAIIDVQTEDAQLEIENMFRYPLIAQTLQGQITLNHNDGNWHLKADQLQLKNEHINTFSRLDIRSSIADNIFVDLQTDFYDAKIKYTNHYLPVAVMEPGLIDWLDMAMTDGYIPSGKLMLYGDLANFPYENHDGVFQVLFSAHSLNMKYLEDWPMLNNMSANIKFNNLALYVSDVKAETNGVSLFNGYTEILDLSDAHLTLTTKAHALSEELQSFVWNSPLDEFLGNAMRFFQISGKSDLNLKLEVPLNQEQVDVTVDGQLSFIDTEMHYLSLGYKLTEMNGVVDFTKDTVFADSLKAKIQNKKVLISASTREGSSGRENVFHLDGVIDADYLLQGYEWIPPDWFSGQSMWSIDIEVPSYPEDYLVHLKARSSLDNVVIQMSDKVNKSAATQLNFDLDMNVLDNNGLQLVARATDSDINKADNVLTLSAIRDAKSVWNFDVNSRYMTGKGLFTEGLAKDTQIKLDLEYLDMHAMFVSTNKKKSEPLKPDTFPPLDWKFKKLSWDNWQFTDVVVQTEWNEHGMLIKKYSLKGPAMTFDASGSWLTSWRGTHETVLRGKITSNNFGDTLTGLGFERSIDRCEYKATFDTQWPAPPYVFSWANITGKTSFEMEDGEIVEADPGAGGRLLGMLNIFKLANRLVLDFDDVTREGFSFDTINGYFEFVKGDGTLKSFDVSAP